jgi:hypothetical protein
MEKCVLCGEPLILPRSCNYCNQYFCEKHQLPEKHRCPGLPNRKWSGSKKTDKKQKKQTITSEVTKISSNTHNSEKMKPIYIWLGILTICVIGFGLYSTGILDNLTNTKEDFSTYTESDNTNQLSFSKNTISFNALNRRTKNTYLYKPFEDSKDFNHWFKFRITDIPNSAEQYLRINLISYTNGLGDFWNLYNGVNSQIFLSVGCEVKNKFFLVLGEHYNGEAYGSQRTDLLDINTEYEVEIDRHDNHFSIAIYESGQVTSTISYDSAYSHDLIYILCCQSLGYPNGNYAVSGSIYDLIL